MTLQQSGFQSFRRAAVVESLERDHNCCNRLPQLQQCCSSVAAVSSPRLLQKLSLWNFVLNNRLNPNSGSAHTPNLGRCCPSDN